MIWGRGNDEIWKFEILTIFGKNYIISMCESMRILVFFFNKISLKYTISSTRNSIMEY